MDQYFLYYTEANIMCLVIFGVMLVHDLLNASRQEKQIKFDNALLAFMVYFAADCVWTAVETGVLPRTLTSVVATNFANCIFMSLITYAWLCYVMAVEAVPHRERLLNKLAVNFPFLVSVIGLVAVYLAAPQALLSPALELKPLYYVFFLAVPYIYIIAIIIYAVQRLRHEESPDERRKHCFVGFFPLIVILGGLVEILIHQQLPVFCFACTVLMLIFYLQSMERQISLDPLTGLNNRGQLLRYVAQKSNARPDGRMTFVMMLDVNDFKKINDTYGHAEGDRALILLSDTLKRVAETMAQRSFLCRYGGDEFVLILHPAIPGVVERVAETIREKLRQAAEREGLPFRLTVSIGFSPLMDEPDTLQSCMQRADEALYENKRSSKRAEAAG